VTDLLDALAGDAEAVKLSVPPFFNVAVFLFNVMLVTFVG
jgi:hypothetical protein